MQSTNPETKPAETLKMSGCPLKEQAGQVWSIDRQVRFTAGLLILNGIALSTINMNWIMLSVIVALGMIVSAMSNTCALGAILKSLPWNH